MRPISVHAAELLKPLRTYSENTLVNLRLITCQSVTTFWAEVEHRAGVEVVKCIDVIKTTEIGQTKSNVQHLFTGDHLFLWISTLHGRERVSFQLAFGICTDFCKETQLRRCIACCMKEYKSDCFPKWGFTEHSSGGETTPLIQPIIRADGT